MKKKSWLNVSKLISHIECDIYLQSFPSLYNHVGKEVAEAVFWDLKIQNNYFSPALNVFALSSFYHNKYFYEIPSYCV